MKVLLVDDDRDQLAIRSLLLRHEGFETFECSTRNNALQSARQEDPQCAVVDLCLPSVEDGLETVRDLRNGSAGLHIIVLTGFHPHTLQHSAALELADEVMLKGSGAGLLVESLRSLELARSLP